MSTGTRCKVVGKRQVEEKTWLLLPTKIAPKRYLLCRTTDEAILTEKMLNKYFCLALHNNKLPLLGATLVRGCCYFFTLLHWNKMKIINISEYDSNSEL